ncbi:hypothetical protein LTR47_012093, partial [Exophiala xenobiotica]
EEALQAIVHPVSPIVVVMGASAGKSALFKLLASKSRDGDGSAGHLALADLADRCQRTGILYLEWDAAQLADGAQIMCDVRSLLVAK